MKVMPVTLPPGRLRLATSPCWTGSLPFAKTIGMFAVADLAAIAETHAAGGKDHIDRKIDEFGRERRQSIVLTLCPAVFDRTFWPLDIAGLVQAPAKGGCRRLTQSSRPPALPRNPITGIAACCARAASGHAAAAPPSSVTNSRRLMPDMGAPSQGAAADHTS